MPFSAAHPTVFFAALFLVALFPFLLSAHTDSDADSNTSSVENYVSVTSSSGGNTAKEGEVVEGKASSDVFIQTIVDGEVVEEIDEHYENLDEPVTKESTYEDGNVKVETKVEVSAEQDPSADSINSLQAGSEQASSGQSATVNEAGEVEDEFAEDSATSTEKEEKSGIVAFFSKLLNYVFSLFA